MPFTPISAPASVCILRLSAIGDTCHVLPVVRSLQHAWPQTRFTWIIGSLEARLLGHIPDIEFIILDKGSLLHSFRSLARAMRGRRFDILMHMQLAMRASALSMLVPARLRLGFDRARARELQWLFTNRRIHPAQRQHVMDSLFGFAEYFQVDRRLQWNIPIPEAARDHARRVIPDPAVPTLLINPCSSHPLRNWRADYYAQVADHAVDSLGMQVVLCGGRSKAERLMGESILALMRQDCRNLIGQDTLLEFLATIERATAVLTPDSGPAHMAAAVGTPVIGLYAATNPARSGPYLSRQWCVDRYHEAAIRYRGKPAAQLPWTTKIEHPGVMELITPEPVIEKLQELLGSPASRQRTS